MAVYHVTKDGTKIDSVKGIVISANQFPGIYRVIERIEERGNDVESISTPKEGA